MRALVTKGGIPTWMNVRESKFIDDYFVETELLEAEGLSEREHYLAQTLVSRGILEKVVTSGKASYKLNVNNFGRV